MPQCAKCEKAFSNRVVIDGKARNINRRKYCLECSPFGVHNTKQIHLPPKKREYYDGHYKYVKKRRKVLKERLVGLKGGKCTVCGYNKCFAALDFHHVDPTQKLFCLSTDMLARKPWDVILAEAAKTVILCKNCHTEVECGLVKLGVAS